MIAPVEMMICTSPESIIWQTTSPILATLMAPEIVSTRVQSGSSAMARRTWNASPRSRPPKAVLDIPRSKSAKPCVV